MRRSLGNLEPQWPVPASAIAATYLVLHEGARTTLAGAGALRFWATPPLMREEEQQELMNGHGQGRPPTDGVPPPDDQEDLLTQRSVPRIAPNPKSRAYESEETVTIARTLVLDQATLMVVDGPGAGAIHVLTGSESGIGRSRKCEIRIEHPAVSRYHARIRRVESHQYVLEDLGSHNHTTIRGTRITASPLADGDRIGLGDAVFLRFAFASRDEHETLRALHESTLSDGLTGAMNRSSFDARLASELAFAQRHKTALSLLLLDIDWFKQINDNFGHQAGDYALKTLSAIVRSTLRTEDVFARYGGEEFAIIARGIRPSHALLLAERVRAIVGNHGFAVGGRPMPITVSIGVASIEDCGAMADAEELMRVADERLYSAKRAGRNRSVGPLGANCTPPS
jgi:two-component system cell cycle response regulator